MYINIYIIMLAKKITVFASGLLFLYWVFLFLFISYNIAMKCLICRCMVSYTLDMRRSLWDSHFFSFYPLTLKGHSQGQRSRSLELVTHQIEATVVWNMMTTIFHFLANIN